MYTKYLIIGASAAGVSCANTLSRLDPGSSIYCLSDEREAPYNKCLLADYVADTRDENSLCILSEEQVKARGITLLRGMQVTAINQVTKSVTCSVLNTGTINNSNMPNTRDIRITYDRLLIATGSRPIMPVIPGITHDALNTHDVYYTNNNRHKSGLFTFHSLHDINHIISFIKEHNVQRIAIVGAGLSGIEAADALRSSYLSHVKSDSHASNNPEIVLLDRGDRILKRHIHEAGSELIEQYVSKSGSQSIKSSQSNKYREHVGQKEHNLDMQVKFVSGATVTHIMRDAFGNVSGIGFNSKSDISTELEAQLVIVTIGVRPNSELARDAGVICMRESIIVDAGMRTNNSDIFAAGDVIVTADKATGMMVRSCTWPDAMQQGVVAAHSMYSMGVRDPVSSESESGPVCYPKPYPGIIGYVTSSFFGLEFAAAGSGIYGPDVKQTIGSDTNSRWAVYSTGGVIKGFCVIGDSTIFPRVTRLRQLLLTGASIDESEFL